MSTPTLFIDRDGPLIERSLDDPVDDPGAIRFTPGVFAALAELAQWGFRLVMVTNEDGPGAPRCASTTFRRSQGFLLESFRSQGVSFDAVLRDPHRQVKNCRCGTHESPCVADYLARESVDLERSALIRDQAGDLKVAGSFGVRGLQLCPNGAVNQAWPEIVRTLTQRRASVKRQTKETDIELRVNLDSEGESISTGIGFFDHMLEQLSKHGGFALELAARGDLQVDEHHTVEDCALALGAALKSALGPKLGIARYGFALPMDEACSAVLLDLSGRPFLKFSGIFGRDRVGAFPTELVPHFFHSLCDGLGATLHISVMGENSHHMVESCFKAVGQALRQAIRRAGTAVPSTKGIL